MSLILLTAVFCSFLTSRHSSKTEGNIKSHNESKLFYKLVAICITLTLPMTYLIFTSCLQLLLFRNTTAIHTSYIVFSAYNYLNFHLLLEWDERQEKMVKMQDYRDFFLGYLINLLCAA